jgi:hypothetical protein
MGALLALEKDVDLNEFSIVKATIGQFNICYMPSQLLQVILKKNILLFFFF